MTRVVRPGGHVIAEFYNPYSLRGVAKKLGPAGAISERTRESAVFTRFDTPGDVAALLPEAVRIVASRGVRIVTPAAAAMRVPGLGRLLHTAERALCDSPLARFAGFWIVAAQRL
jgi:hypothetical protein